MKSLKVQYSRFDKEIVRTKPFLKAFQLLANSTRLNVSVFQFTDYWNQNDTFASMTESRSKRPHPKTIKVIMWGGLSESGRGNGDIEAKSAWGVSIPNSNWWRHSENGIWILNPDNGRPIAEKVGNKIFIFADLAYEKGVAIVNEILTIATKIFCMSEKERIAYAKNANSQSKKIQEKLATEKDAQEQALAQDKKDHPENYYPTLRDLVSVKNFYCSYCSKTVARSQIHASSYDSHDGSGYQIWGKKKIQAIRVQCCCCLKDCNEI